MKHSSIKIAISLLSLCLFFLFSCSENSVNIKFTKFPNEYSLKATDISLDEFYKHGRLHFYDTLTIITNTPGDKKQIHIYNKNFKYITSSGAIGRGPGEITNPFLATLDDENGVIWFLDMGKKKILKFPLDSMLINPRFLPTEAIPIPSEIPIILGYASIGENLFSFSNIFSNSVLIAFQNKKGDIIDSLEIVKSNQLKNLDNISPKQPLATYMYKKHPNKNLFAIGYRFSDIIAIINAKGEVIAISQGPDMINQVPDASKRDQLSTYTDIQCDENYIYALYRGDHVFDDNMNLVVPKTIHVFSWDGTPVAKLNIEHSGVALTIQNNPKSFFTFSMSTGGIVSYNFPDNLKQQK